MSQIKLSDQFLTLKNYKEPLIGVPRQMGYGYFGAILGTEDEQIRRDPPTDKGKDPRPVLGGR